MEVELTKHTWVKFRCKEATEREEQGVVVSELNSNTGDRLLRQVVRSLKTFLTFCKKSFARSSLVVRYMVLNKPPVILASISCALNKSQPWKSSISKSVRPSSEGSWTSMSSSRTVTGNPTLELEIRSKIYTVHQTRIRCSRSQGLQFSGGLRWSLRVRLSRRARPARM